MKAKDQDYYQKQLQIIQARNLSGKHRSMALVFALAYWGLLFLLIRYVAYVWIPYVTFVQQWSNWLNGWLTYFFATLFVLLWLYAIYAVFQQGLKYWLRCLSGVREK